MIRGRRDGTSFAKERPVRRRSSAHPHLEGLVYAGRRHCLNAAPDDFIAIRQPLVVHVAAERRTHNAIAISLVQLERHHFGTVAGLHRLATTEVALRLTGRCPTEIP